MKLVRFKSLAALALAATLSSAAHAAVVISDAFETGSGADYTVVDGVDVDNGGAPDGTVNFAFDYVAAGIPLAPRSSVGDRSGLRFTVNDSLALTHTQTAFHNSIITAPAYRLTVDVFMGFSGTAGTTEFAHVGVGGDGATPNSIFSPISGSGSFLSFTGDGGSGSDYRWFLAGANGGPTSVTNTDPSYLSNGSNNTGPFFQSLFPLSSGASVAGSPGNIWTTVDIDVADGTISYFFDGTLTFQGTYTGSLDGLVSLGLHDAFTSVDPGTVFTLYDNLTVTAIPEPTTTGLLGLATLGFVSVRLRKRFARA